MITSEDEVVAIASTVEMGDEILEERFGAERCCVVAVTVEFRFADEAFENLRIAGCRFAGVADSATVDLMRNHLRLCGSHP
jgi:hypothetical protein